MSPELETAIKYETEHENEIGAEERPLFHLSSRVGWMNDPNGFSIYGGRYHLFYQYHPYNSYWGPMHWGHAVSRDLLRWEYMPCVMAPDSDSDRDGCFSGSAVTLPDGKHLLMYTGIVSEIPGGFGGRAVQTQNLAVGDGITYRKYEHNPVIDESSLPEGGSRYAFRDPRIWKEEDGTYRAIVANDSAAGGRILLYRSEDAFHWTFDRVLAENNGRIGKMWECPDFFELDGQYVLMASAQDMLPQDLEYHNGNGTFYMFGDYDRERGIFRERSNHAVDYGIDFYAPQTLKVPDGRRIMIGWLQNWDTCTLRTEPRRWFGQMSVPRELSVRNGILYQTPVRELMEYRGQKTEFRDIEIENREITLPGVYGRTADVEIEIQAADAERLYRKFAVRFARNEMYHTAVSYRPGENALKIDRKFSGSRRAVIHQRRAEVRHTDGRLKLRLILDRFSAEVFVNDGEKVMSAVIYTDPGADGISFYADGKVRISVTHYPLS